MGKHIKVLKMGYKHNDTIGITMPEPVYNNHNNDYVDPLDNSYWLGVPMINVLQDGIVELLVGHRITVDEFYATNHSCEIIQIKYVRTEDTPFVAYHAIIKTFWLREFQRRWRRRP